MYIYTYLLHTIFRKMKVYAMRKTRVDIYNTQGLHKDKGTYRYIYIPLDFQKDQGICIVKDKSGYTYYTGFTGR